MKKGDMFEAVVETIDFPNKGILHVDGERVIVKNAIPGQKVRFVVNKKRKGKCEARLLEVLEKSPLERSGGTCPHFGICGGCLYQSLPYEEQLKIKEGQIKALLDEVCDSYEFEGIKASPVSDGYRNKMEFSFGDEYKDGPLALGMHRRGSFYDIVNTPECQIVHEDFCKILTATLHYFTKKHISYHKKMQHTGYLRHLLVRRAVKTGEILVALVTSGQTENLSVTEAHTTSVSEKELLEGWLSCLQGLQLEGTFAGILHIRNDSLADVVQSDETTILYGQDFFYEELLGLKFRITPFSFFQTNSLGAEVLYETARSYVGETKDKVVFDLYSGTGTIAQIIAPVAEKVVGVEIVEEAVEAAKENAAGNGLDNCEFIAGDVLKVIGELKDKPDLIILDPPRDGIHPKALDKIIDFGVDRMVYISCKPTSLTRDLVVLQERGYKLEKACAVDMFPATANCETVCLLGRKIVNDKNVEYAHVDYEPKDAEYLKSAKGSASYREIKEWIKEQHDVSVSNLYIAQVKDKLGFEKRENYNTGAEGHRVPNCPAEKEKLSLEAFEHFRMI